jgi:hypothetical protein
LAAGTCRASEEFSIQAVKEERMFDDLRGMSRRRALRISLGSSGTLRGPFSALDCIVTEVAAGGARIALEGRLPSPPLTLCFTIAGELIELPVTVHRVPVDGGVVVEFVLPATEHFHRLIAAEQRLALSAGRLNVVERRAPRPGAPDTVRGEVL